MDIMIYKKKAPALVFLIPAFAFMIIFLYYPFIMNIVNSFFETYMLGSDRGPFLGLDHYKEMFGEIQNKFHEIFNFIPASSFVTDVNEIGMGTAFVNTMLLMASTIIFQVGLALVLAILVDTVSKGTQFFRTLYFFPIIITATALGMVFNLVFGYEPGVLNDVVIGMGGKRILWKEDYLLVSMFVPVLWQYVGYYFVIIATGINNISTDVNEAAEIDGAIGFKRVRYITWPLLHNTLITCLTLAITGSLKVFDLPWVMFPQGIPQGRSFLTGSYMYDQTFNAYRSGYAASIGVFIVVLGVLMSVFTRTVFKERDY